MNSSVLLKQFIQQKQIISSVNRLTYLSVRCSGGHGHSDHHYHYEQSLSSQTRFKIPTQEDIDYQLPKKGIWNEKIHQWIAGRWAVDREDVLQNDKVNKFSAYYWFSTSPIFQNAFFLRLVRLMFDNQGVHERNHHDSFRGVKTNENSLFLYKSNQADAAIRARMIDYLFAIGGMMIVTGTSQMIALPIFVCCLQLPRLMASFNYFTFHAELLPHTEQVVFHKAKFFGGVTKIIVDIKNLEKVEPDVVPSKILWGINMFDAEMVFRDMETKEVFVFDANGIWNEDTLKHKLLY